MVMMNDTQFSIVIRLGSSMLRSSTDMCVICGSRGVNIKFGHFFVTILLYANMRKQFA